MKLCMKVDTTGLVNRKAGDIIDYKPWPQEWQGMNEEARAAKGIFVICHGMGEFEVIEVPKHAFIPEFTRAVSALEYEALLNLDRIIRVAMSQPGAAEFLVVAIQSLDQVRRDEGLETPPIAPPMVPGNAHDVRQVSGLAQALIKRAMDKKT